MKTIVLKTGETAYIPTSSEKEVIILALRNFQVSLHKGEVIDG